MNIINTLENIRNSKITLGILLVTLLGVYQSSSAAVPTRQIISNMAIGEYTEEGSTVVQVSRSNLVQTTILPVYSVNLTANSIKNVVAGQTVYFNHTLNNTGNEVDQYTFAVTNNTGDSYDFTNLSVFLDKDNDGVPDGAAITSYSLSAGESVGLIVAANVPSGATVSQSGLLTLNVTSLNNASGTKTNVDTATVSNQSVVIVRKKFSQTTVANGDVVTVRLDYQNLGSIATGSVTLTDVLDPSLVYQLNSGENWNGTTVNPSTGSNDPVGINYSVTSNTLTAVLSSIAANSVGYIEFKVGVNRTLAGKINNTVNFQYDHDNNTATATIADVSNIAVLNLAPIYAVKINGSVSDVNNSSNIIATPVLQGGELVFNNYVWNTGNSTDLFNLTLTGSTFPAGSQIEFYRADGVTPLLDSNADGIPDTGLITSGTNLPIIVKVRLPSSYAVTTDTTFEVSPQAQSLGDITKTSLIKDQGNLLATTAARLVDLTNSPENNGLGNGNIDSFGRRNMDLSYDELYADVLYQISALQGLAQVAGTKVTYVKPHGALYNTIATNLAQAKAVIDAMQHFDETLVLVALAGSPLIHFAREQGLTVISEAFADRAYHRNGALVSRRLEGAVLHDAEVIAQRVLNMVLKGGIESIEGDFTVIHADTICVHGDTFGAVQMAEKIRQVLLENQVEVRAFHG